MQKTAPIDKVCQRIKDSLAIEAILKIALVADLASKFINGAGMVEYLRHISNLVF